MPSDRAVVNPQLAFVFPGQGSQSVGMLADLSQHETVVSETFQEASDALGYDLWGLVANGPEADLNRTDRTQPAMLTAGVAVWRAWCRRDGGRPALMAGHSLGEYTALVCAEALTFPQAVQLVAQRGRFMQEAVPQGQGAMAAILGLEDEQVQVVCREAAQGEIVTAVNYNSPGQVVVAGAAAAVARAIEAAKAAGAKRALLLPVSVPSHCALMQPAADNMRMVLKDVAITPTKTPVINNADVACYQEPEQIRDALVRQLVSPVRWVETVKKMATSGVRNVVECGPGKVLAGLNKRIDRDMIATAVYDNATLDAALAGDD